eukprot:2293147-Rhodomonas_salina.1
MPPHLASCRELLHAPPLCFASPTAFRSPRQHPFDRSGIRLGARQVGCQRLVEVHWKFSGGGAASLLIRAKQKV